MLYRGVHSNETDVAWESELAAGLAIVVIVSFGGDCLFFMGKERNKRRSRAEDSKLVEIKDGC